MIFPQRYGQYLLRDHYLSGGFDALVLQLLDTNMDIIAEGATLLVDSIGRPLFKLNVDRQEVYDVIMGGYSQHYFDIFEVLFDTVVSVIDSFYLAAHFKSFTQSEDNFGIAVPGIYELHRWGYGVYVDSSHYYDFPKFTNHARGGYRLFSNSSVIDTVPVANDEWFTIEACEENHGFAMIFPILAVDCEAPDSVVWAPMGGGNVRVSWEQGQWTSGWEVSYGPTGTLPGEGTVLQTTAPAAMLSGITMDTDYVVYVRSLCTVRDTVWSEWSTGTPFSLRPQGIEAISDADLTLVPNPTSGAVLLTADAEITGVEVYTSAGVPFLRLPASGRTVRFDTSTWPAGTYLLEVSTARGTTTKRLVVTR